jgi:hypothetical protein
MWGRKEDQKRISELTAENFELRKECEKLRGGTPNKDKTPQAQGTTEVEKRVQMPNNYWRYSQNQLIDRICRLEVITENDQRRLRALAAENVELRSECERLSQANRASTKSADRAEGIAALARPVAPPLALPAPVVFVTPGQYEEAMVATLNLWWQDANRDRKRLLELLKQLRLPARFYTMNAFESVLQTVSWNGPYSLQPSEKDGGWLWCDLTPEGEALLLPADSAFFNTDPMRKILQRIIMGCENVTTKPEFRSASQACLLGPSQDKEGWFRVNRKGVVWVEGQPKPQTFRGEVRTFDSFFVTPTVRQPAPPTTVAVTSQEQPSQTVLLKDIVSAFGKLRTELARIEKKVDKVSNEIEKIKPAPLPLPPRRVPRPAEVTIEVPPCVPLSPDALKRAYAIAASAPRSDYPARLQTLRQALKSECSDLSFEISHLSLQAGRFATHPARIAEPNSIVCETCGRNPGERQCFLTASAGQPGSVWVLLPPSDLNKFDFPNGYVLLLDPAPPGTFTIGSVWQPASLISNEVKDRLFQVYQKMAWGASQG